MAWCGEDFDIDLCGSRVGSFVDLAAQLRELTTRRGVAGGPRRAIEIPLAEPLRESFSTFALHVLAHVALHGFDDALIDLAGHLERKNFLHERASIAAAGAGDSSFRHRPFGFRICHRPTRARRTRSRQTSAGKLASIYTWQAKTKTVMPNTAAA